ncbi:hypothetical protein GTO91_02765 [Heliobacterium undosum]|uniref:Uncharacterized protein n=1 Tax=Heliomicrobium undosum TaxID=121734 RepID=A0A845L6W4_9FIRM|nr:hypothetical protein [Heliomicrobium undosum]MZP28641.1 hypothetical protein [Heliomicrobium undosum]
MLSEATYPKIKNMDSEEFKKHEANWKLSEQQIKMVKGIYPELQHVDISEWTNADFNAYSLAQTDKKNAPTPEQSAKLKEKGIPLNVARKMLKEFHSYENLLTQPDDVINKLKNEIVEADKQFNEHIQRPGENR